MSSPFCFLTLKPWNYLRGDKQNVTIYDSTAKNLFYISFDEKDDSTLHRVGFDGPKVVDETIRMDRSVKIVDLAVAKDRVYVVGREGLKWKFLILSPEGRKLAEFVAPLESTASQIHACSQRMSGFQRRSSIKCWAKATQRVSLTLSIKVQDCIPSERELWPREISAIL